jgi:hypothetical protein
MEISITGNYTVPNFNFDLEIAYLNLLGDKIEQNLLHKFPLPKVKSQELEIYICTDGKSTESFIQKISKTDKGKFLTFYFWLPYTKIVKQINENMSVEMDLVVFTEEFFACLKQVLITYNIDEKSITQTQQEILDEITANKTYIFNISAQETAWRIGKKEVLEDFRVKKIE